MAHVDKIIVTNVVALKAKYGTAYKQVSAAVAALVAADAKRGLVTKLVDISDARTMKAIGAASVTGPGSKQYKDAVDAVFAAYSPDYLTLLGAVDVIPHQDLVNPVKGDGDPIAWGDLPYACAAPYSKRVEDFRSPTRVVGRLPDITNGSDASYLVAVLKNAATYKCLPATTYEPYLGISASVWEDSTRMSLENTFGTPAQLELVPPQGPRWSPSQLSRRSHFINCHGGPADPQFYGQKGSAYPVAHAARLLAGKVAEGTVVAAECCFGAELYDPAVAKGQMGICNTYLGGGAYGFFGSSTTAYGPSSGNGSADLICQYFMQRVLAGSSLGRAALEARQHFIQTMSVLDPSDLKTLAQFSLMGDPSIHPVSVELPALARTKLYAEALPNGNRTNRGLRRERLTKFGLAIGSASGAARRTTTLKPAAKTRKLLVAAAAESGVAEVAICSYGVHSATGKSFGKSLLRPPSAFHVAVGRRRVQHESVSGLVLIIATEIDGELVRLRRLHAR